MSERRAAGESMAGGPDPGDPGGRAFDRRLALTSAALAAFYILGFLGLALLPLLVHNWAWVVILLNPTTGVIILVSPRVALVPFVALATLRRLASHILFFQMGAWYGGWAVAWVEGRSGRALRLVRVVERLFARVRWPVILLWPGPLPSVLAGAGGMRRALFLALDLAGTLLGVLLARFAADVARDPLAALLRLIDEHPGKLTALCAALIGVWLLVRWRAGARGTDSSLRSE